MRAFGVGVAVGVIPELAKHPGAEDDAESGQTTQDLGVRVLAKRLLKVACTPSIWTDRLVKHAHSRGHARSGGVGEQRWRGQLLGLQRLVDRLGARVQVPPAASAAKHAHQRSGSVRRRLRTKRASTVRRFPDALVIGAVPA